MTTIRKRHDICLSSYFKKMGIRERGRSSMEEAGVGEEKGC